jgi:hypothetical protein
MSAPDTPSVDTDDENRSDDSERGIGSLEKLPFSSRADRLSMVERLAMGIRSPIREDG